MPRRRVLNESALLGLQYQTSTVPAAPAERPAGPRLTVEFEDGRTVFAHLSAVAAEAVARAAASGEEIALLELGAELSSSEAATLLGMSRPTLNKLLDEGLMTSRREGRDRRVQLTDVLAFKQRRARMDAARTSFGHLASTHPHFFAGGDDEDDEFDPSVMEPAG